MERLSENAVRENLAGLNGWQLKNNGIEKSFEFNNFKEAFSAMTHIAMECEVANHHPEWSNVYNRLHIRFSTHDAGGITKADFNLAKIVDGVIG